MRKKAAIELSMNLIVVIILSIVILGAGIALTRTIFGGAEEIQLSLDERTQSAIEDSLRDSPVSIPFADKEAGRGDARLFGLGVMNMLGTNKEFRFDVQLLRVQPSTINTELDILYNTESFPLEDNNVKVSQIRVDVPKDAETGTYVYTVRVEYLEGAVWQQYQSRNIYMTVR